MALFFRPSANLRESWRSTTALRCSLTHTSSTGTEKSCENFSHPNSGIHRICWRISTPSSDKPKNEHQKDNQTQRHREFPEQIQENAHPLSLALFFSGEGRVFAWTFLGKLLVTQGLNGVEFGGLHGGEPAADHADHNEDGGRQHHGDQRESELDVHFAGVVLVGGPEERQRADR